jgi:SAM-dependent methyltransferase
MDLAAEHSNALFAAVADRDREQHLTEDYLDTWEFMERRRKRPRIVDLSFYEYEGPSHILKFIGWIDEVPFNDWFLGPHEALVQSSVSRDRACLDSFGLDPGDLDLQAIGTYNAQDYLLQRFYPVLEEQMPRVILDFGGGHGRMANLAFRPEERTTETMIVVDGIAGPYLTQRAYYTGLGLRLADYIDHSQESGEFDVATVSKSHDVVHLPTWRLDLVPDNSVDMVCCVQVLKELPRQLVVHVLEEFARVVKPGGALYVRDHLYRHHPNLMPIDQLILGNGFVLEFQPHVYDMVQIHGVPRVWRKVNPAYYGRAAKG